MAKLHTLTDNFDDNSLSGSWTVGTGTWTEQNQRLEHSGALSLDAMGTASTYDLDESSGFIELVSLPNPSEHLVLLNFNFSEEANANFTIDGGVLSLYSPNDADTPIYTTTYNATTHRWLRLRETGGTLYWDCSSDGKSWTNLDSEAYAGSTATTTVGIYVYSAVEDTIIFDNFNVIPPHEIAVTDTIWSFDTYTNLVTNPSFESDTSTWGLDGDFTRVTSDSFSGSASVRQISTSGFANFTTQNDVPSGYDVQSNRIYTFSFYYKMAITSGSGVNIEIKDNTPYGGATLASDVISSNAGSWTRKTITFRTGASTAKVWFRLYNNNGSCTAFYDAFQLEKGSFASTFTLTSATSSTVQVSAPTLSVNKSDSITVTEQVTSRLAISITKSDSISLTESVTVSRQPTTTYAISASDSISVSESLSVNLIAVATLLIVSSDSVSVAESIALLVATSMLAVSVSDTVGVTESIGRVLTSSIFVSDGVELNESVGFSGQSRISVSDTIQLAEALKLLNEANATPSDSIGITENISISIEAPTDFIIEVADSVGLTDVITATIPELFFSVSVTDTVSVTENISPLLSVSVHQSDSISVTDTVTTFTDKLYLGVEDTVGVSEAVEFDSFYVKNQNFVYEVAPHISMMIGSPRMANWNGLGRPQNPVKGQYGYNVEHNQMEVWSGSAWYTFQGNPI